jgi:ABC-2 type transport system permease protein
MKVIYILWLRQLKRYYRSRSRIIGALGQPVLFLLALGFGLGPVFQQAGQGNYFQFLVPGIISQSVLFTSIFSGVEIIWDRQFGFLKETLVAPVSRFQIVIGRTLGGAAVATIQGLIVLIISIIIGFRIPNLISLLLTIIFMLLIALLFCSLGTAIASSLDDVQGFQLIINFLIMPLFFLSGALFPLNGIPRVLQYLVYLDPLSYGVDGLRGILLGLNHFSLLTDFSILGILTLIVLALGSYLFSKIQV